MKSGFVSSANIAASIFQSLATAVHDAGGTDEDLRRLETERDLADECAKLIVAEPKHLNGTFTFTVDTSEPSWPGDWTEENGWEAEHRSMGTVEVSFRNGEMYIDDVKVVEYRSPKQEHGDVIGGEKLAKLRFADTEHPDLPDAILDLVLREQDHPAVAAFLAKYEVQRPFFWGTVYTTPGGGRRVRCLRRFEGRRVWYDGRLGDVFDRYFPVLILERSLRT